MSTDGSYRVDLEHLDIVTARVGGLRGFVQDSLSGVDQRIIAAHREWSGEAADRHAAAHREWMTAAGQVKDGIDAMHTAARTAHTAYTEGLAAIHKTFGA